MSRSKHPKCRHGRRCEVCGLGQRMRLRAKRSREASVDAIPAALVEYASWPASLRVRDEETEHL